MATLRTTNLQHPSSAVPNLVLQADGTVGGPGAGGFDSAVLITATDTSWNVPPLASPVVRVTCVGGGGGGGASRGGAGASGGTGGTTTFDTLSAGLVSASGGAGGRGGNVSIAGSAGSPGQRAYNGGRCGTEVTPGGEGETGAGGEIVVAYLDLTGISAVNVTIGAGGASGVGTGPVGGVGGRGEVLVEYKAAP